MRIEIDLTEEEMKMIRLSLQDRGNAMLYQLQQGRYKEQEKYYDLIYKFNEATRGRLCRV